MRTRATVDPDLVHVRRHIDAPVTIQGGFIGYCGTHNLYARIQNCQVNRMTIELGGRAIDYTHLTQHLQVVAPQLCNALEEGTVVNTVFAESQIVIWAGDLLRAPGLDFLDHRLL